MSLSIVFVNPPTPKKRRFTRNIGCAAESKGSYLLKSLDFLTLSGPLSLIGDVQSLDFVSKPLEWTECIQSVVGKKPDILVVSMIDVIFENDLNFLKDLRSHLTSQRIYVLGDAFIEPVNAAAVQELVDGIIIEPFILNPHELLKHEKGQDLPGLRNTNSYKTKNKQPLKVEIAVPRHDLFDDLYYRWPFAKHARYTCVTTVWGCPYACSYCTAAKFPVHYRDYQNVIQEMDTIKNLGFKEIYITDFSFGLPLNNTIALLEEMIQRKYHFTWSTYFHPLQYNPELLELMAKAGCHTLITGIETSDEKILKAYGRVPSHQKTEQLVEHAHQLKMEVCGDFMIGLKEQDQDELKRNIELSLALKLDYASFNLVAPLPGTVLREAAVQAGAISGHGHGFDSLGNTDILSFGKISSARLRKTRNEALFRFYLRPNFIFSKLFSRGSVFRVWQQGMNFLSMFFKAHFSAKKPEQRKR